MDWNAMCLSYDMTLVEYGMGSQLSCLALDAVATAPLFPLDKSSKPFHPSSASKIIKLYNLSPKLRIHGAVRHACDWLPLPLVSVQPLK